MKLRTGFWSVLRKWLRIKKRGGGETGEENLAEICVKAMCHRSDTWVGMPPLLQGQSEQGQTEVPAVPAVRWSCGSVMHTESSPAQLCVQCLSHLHPCCALGEPHRGIWVQSSNLPCLEEVLPFREPHCCAHRRRAARVRSFRPVPSAFESKQAVSGWQDC